MIIIRLRSFGSLVKVVSLILIRSKTILILVLSISTPIAMTTAISLSTSLLHEQAKVIAGLIQPKPSAVITDAPYENCVAVDVVYAYAIYDNYSFYVQMHIAREFNRYIDALNIRLMSESGSQNGILSIGEALASRYGINVGKPITICLSKQCYNLTVQAIHRGLDFFNYIVITNMSIAYNNSTMYVCLNTVNPALSGILHSIGRDTERFLDFLSIIIPLSYMLVVFIAINRIVSSYKSDIALMVSLGISRKKLMASFISVFILIAYVFALYGIALGVVFFHLSIWVLMFIGMPVFVRPMPSINLAVVLSFVYIPMVVPSLALAFMKLGEES